LVQDGVSYVVTDTSVIGQPNNGPNPSPNVGIVNSYAPSLYEVPRRPNDVFFNAANWSDDQAEFSCIYNNPVQPPYNAFNAAQILDYVSSSFVTNMLIGDMDPEMFHQPNLHDYDGQGHSLISDTYDQTFSKYERLFQRGVVSLTLDQLGQNMKNRNAYNLSTATASLTGAPGSNQTISITVPATAAVPGAIIPVTGLYSNGAEAYGGQYISHIQLTSGQTISFAVPSEPLLPSASSLALNPTSVTGGTQSPTGTVTLSGLAPTAGAQVMLSSSNAAASVPSSVTVPAGSNSATFTVSTSPVAASTQATIFASYDGVSPSASLTVTPLPSASSLTLNPSSVTGGAQSSVGTVMLSGPAPAGGAQVLLSSNNAAASVPSSVTVPAGSSNATFTISTTAVASSTPASISASYGGASISASLTVLPPVPSALTLSPTSVTGATSSPTGTVTLNGPAPAGGAQVLLSSSSAVARVPANGVTVPAGATTATFTLSTSAVATSTTVTISASFGGGTQTATLTVLPPIVSSLTLNPTSVIGGPLGTSTGTVTLNGPAPAGGAQVMLSSSNAAASVPPNGVTVPAGATTATFTVTTNVVVGSTSATISASYNSTTQSASLAVTL
jgi:trimeric autotransporter adhesin